MYNSHLSVDIQSSYRLLYYLLSTATEATSSRRGMAARKICKKITVIGLYNYGEDVGNTLQYVLKSFTDAQQQRQHGQKRRQTEERRRITASRKTSPRVREKFEKNNGHWASQVRWRRRKYIAICSKIIYRRATTETARRETKTNSGTATRQCT